MNLVIRNITSQDFDEYKKLINSDISVEYFNNFLNNVLCDTHIIIVVLLDNILIGTCTLFIEQKLTHGGSKMGHIENVLISDEYKGNGYGEKIIENVLNRAKTSGCYRVDLNCNEELEKFYEKNGFGKKHICMNIYFKDNFI